MSSFYAACLLLVTSALVGCASVSVPKPALVGDKLKRVAEIDFFSEQCSRNGLMVLETAAYGKRLVAMAFEAHQVDMEAFNHKKAYIGSFNPGSQELCNALSLHILAYKSKLDEVKSTATTTNSQPYTPRFTNCSTNFGQTFCTSY